MCIPPARVVVGCVVRCAVCVCIMCARIILLSFLRICMWVVLVLLCVNVVCVVCLECVGVSSCRLSVFVLFPRVI